MTITISDEAPSAAEPLPSRLRSLVRLPLPRALPAIRGRWKSVYLAIWLVAFATAIVAPAVTAYLRLSTPAPNESFLRLGLWPLLENGEIRLAHPFTEEARRSGIRKGDILIRINGRDTPRDEAALPQLRRLLAGPEEAQVFLQTISPAGQIREHLLTRSQSHVERFYASVGLSRSAYEGVQTGLEFAPTLIFVVTGILLFIRRRDDTVAALMSLSFLLIAVGYFGYRFFFAIGASGWDRPIGDLGWTIFFLALLAFPSGRFEPRWTSLAALAVVAPLFLWNLWPDATIMSNAAAIVVLGLVVIAMTQRYRHVPVGAERQQIRWALFGFASGFLLISVNIVIGWRLEIADNPAPALMLGSFIGQTLTAFLAFLCIAGGLLVSLLRYRLYDAESVISRSAGYAITTLAAAAVFAGSAKTLEVLFEANFGGEARAVAGGMGAALAALLVTPAHNRIHAWAERRFQKALLHLRRDLPECVADLRETASLSELLDEIIVRLSVGVRARWAAVVIGDEVIALQGIAQKEVEGWRERSAPGANTQALDCQPEEPLFPLRMKLCVGHSRCDEPIGWILLGPRPDGSFFGKDEREALAGVLDPVARAIQIVQVREREKASLERRLAAFEQRLTDLASLTTERDAPRMPPALA